MSQFTVTAVETPTEILTPLLLQMDATVIICLFYVKCERMVNILTAL